MYSRLDVGIIQVALAFEEKPKIHKKLYIYILRITIQEI